MERNLLDILGRAGEACLMSGDYSGTSFRLETIFKDVPHALAIVSSEKGA